MGRGLAPKTAYVYVRTLEKVEVELRARATDLMSCTPEDVSAVAQLWPGSHSSRQGLRSALLTGWEFLDRPDGPRLARAVRVPPKPAARCRAIEPDAATMLERAAWDRGDLPGLAVLVGLYAGLRRAEIARLRWEDVICDEHGTIGWMRVHGKWDLVADVPVHPVLGRALAAHRAGRGWVFPGRFAGRPVSVATIWDWCRHVAEDAGLAKIPPHVLRHTALAEMNDRSHDLRAVQQIARHSRPETTAGYTRTTSARMVAVTSMIDYGRRLEAEAPTG